MKIMLAQAHGMRILDLQIFPLQGEKGDLSPNEQRRERWKSEMLERSKGTTMPRPEDDEFRSTCFPRSLEFSESTDEEEMGGWFGHGKTETKMND